MRKEDHKEATKRMIEVMQAYMEGKPIEASYDGGSFRQLDQPSWNWMMSKYRIATIPDSIDWSHVSPEWTYMARDESGDAALFQEKPSCRGNAWDASFGGYALAAHFASYKRGTVDWKDSLVKRPE
jgi:hypothetical protein